ncbi:uncharacterized protein EV422DRAFT_306881 [Fimicolochytrium jonesii]|uniref:uncharacterized protein n=1 Tax=Fimicolochytrium jonesii TaxID=1396493 RepID=UPI0022FED5B5|nr:uncharacterized protein EV422DRAFT_306881 [Fimicolochytrium jonesii]KAI8824107.1 hypothetical protein EV422DRAFT_306881 [Fimicolochytrium jonesii]
MPLIIQDALSRILLFSLGFIGIMAAHVDAASTTAKGTWTRSTGLSCTGFLASASTDACILACTNAYTVTQNDDLLTNGIPLNTTPLPDNCHCDALSAEWEQTATAMTGLVVFLEFQCSWSGTLLSDTSIDSTVTCVLAGVTATCSGKYDCTAGCAPFETKGFADWVDASTCLGISCPGGIAGTKKQTRTCTLPAKADGTPGCNGVTQRTVGCVDADYCARSVKSGGERQSILLYGLLAFPLMLLFQRWR